MMIKLHLLKNKLFSTVYMECGMLGIGIVIWMLAYFCSDFNLAIAGITVAFLANLTYSIKHFREQFVFFFMQISIFTFLISRPMIGWLSGMDWWNNASQAEENVWFALSLLIVTETALFLGNLLTVYLVKKNSNRIYNSYLEGMTAELRFISQVIFYITMLFYLVEQLEPLFVIGIGNYLSYYTDFTSQLPGIIHTIASFMKYSLCIFLATLPSKRSAMLSLILYVLSTIPSLLIGVRNPFILSLLFCLVYFLLRDYLCDSKRWVGKCEKILIFIGTPVLLVFFTVYASFRSGLDVKVGNVFSSILDFFYGQGVSFDVLCIGYGYMLGLKILCPCNYTFGGIIDYLYRGTIGQKLFNTQPLTSYNSVFNAKNSNSLSHALSYLSLKDDYLAGRGRGSSYLLEVMTDFGWIGVIVFSLLLGSLLILMVYSFGRKILLSTLILACLQNIFFMPRAEATSWLTFIVTLQFWCCVAGCYLGAFIFNKWKIIPKAKKILELKKGG